MANANSNSVPTDEPLVARKRKLGEIMISEPLRVIQHPIRLWSSRQNNAVAANFFELWLDEKFQPDLVYCHASRKIITRHKRQNSNLVRHLKMHNQCNAALREAADAPRETGSTSERDGESTGSKFEVATCDEDGASAASASACEIERETGSTPTTASLLTDTLSEVEPVSTCSFRFIIRGLSSSTYRIEAAPSDANLAASHTSEPESESPHPPTNQRSNQSLPTPNQKPC